MAYDKKLSKSERKSIKSTRRFTKATGFRESEKHLSAIRHQHVQSTHKVSDISLIMV